MSYSGDRIDEGPIRVLHVDDDHSHMEMTAEFLEREDERFTVITDDDAEAGLDRLAVEEIDCIVSDYNMPGMNGIEFLKAVREDYPDLPFILFTGRGSEEIASEAISAGVTDYLQKGSGTDRYAILANRISNIIARYRAENARQESEERYRQLVENSPNAIAVFRDERIVYANDAMVELLNADHREQLHGIHPKEFVQPEYHEVLEDRLERVKQDESVGWQEGLIERFDGETRHIETIGGAVEYGGESAIQIVLRDITERKERERELELFRNLIDRSNDEIFVIDPETARLVDANETACRRLGYERNELLDQAVLDIENTIPDMETWSTHVDTVRSEDGVVIEGERETADGTTYPVEVNVVAISLDGNIWSPFPAISPTARNANDNSSSTKPSSNR